ncbi:diadenylate cyclase CdaA [Urechidicola sp. KH5]
MLDFLDLSFLDILDVVLVAVLLYYIYKLLRGTVAINIFIGITIVFLIYKITDALEMEMLSGILGTLTGGGIVALIVVFQQEIRKFLLMLGTTNYTNKKSFLKQLKFVKSEAQIETDVETIIETCLSMGSQRTGALIVLERTQKLDFVKSSGDKMNAQVNKPILESIFYKNSPLHDGAIIIKDNEIVATRIILPLTEKELPSRFGLRHRAAIGITEKSDALSIVVSEETGKLSYIKDGEFVLFDDTFSLIETIKSDLT